MKDLIIKNFLPIVLAVLCVAIICRIPIATSLWLDESMSWWVVKDTFADLIHRSLAHQGQPLLYAIFLWIWRQLGTSEIWLRLPSTIGIILSAWFLFDLVRTLVDRNSAFLAVIFFLSTTAVQVAATSVRPYAMALFFCMWGLWILGIRTSAARPWRLYSSAILLGLSVHFHLFFAGALLVALCLLRSATKNLPTQRRLLATWVIVFGLVIVPALWQFRHWPDLSQVFVHSRTPRIIDILQLFVAPHIAVCLICGLLCGFIAKRFKIETSRFNEKILLLIIWALLPALLLLNASLLGGIGIYQRWILWSVPGTCLALAILIQAISNNLSRTVCIAISSILLLGFEVNRSWQSEDWRGAMQIVNAQVMKEKLPIMLYSGLTETAIAPWLLDPNKHDFFKAPLSYYQTIASVYPAPRNPSEEHASQVLADMWTKIHSPFLLVGLNQGVENRKALQEYEAIFRAKGWDIREIGDGGSVRVSVVGSATTDITQ